jgi:cation diffusion facilitator CzcD-associated flavoprotein CzcO
VFSSHLKLSTMSTKTQRPFVPIIIIGAGFSGLAAACRLQQKFGFKDYQIYEKSANYGGTWWNNQCESIPLKGSLTLQIPVAVLTSPPLTTVYRSDQTASSSTYSQTSQMCSHIFEEWPKNSMSNA